MPLITTAATVTAIWVGVEVVGGIIAEETLKEASKPLSQTISNWLQEKTGWKEKKRERAFRDAYQNAESRLVSKIGVTEAYRAFRTIPMLMDREGRREELAFALLEYDEEYRRDLTENAVYSLSFGGSVSRSERGEIANYITTFFQFLREELYNTEIYQPLVEFYAQEAAQQIRKQLLFELRNFSPIIDNDLRAIRVIIADSANFEQERQVYLEQIAAYFEEHEFSGFEGYGERPQTIMLDDIFIPLSIRREGGGEELTKDLSKLTILDTGEHEANK